jgi:tellurite resistance protein TerC
VDGRRAALQFFTGYLLEKSLSLDNILLMTLVFTHFRVPLVYQHRVLFWGVFGALALRAGMIGMGAELMSYDWAGYLFGAVLVFTAIKMLVIRHDNIRPNRNPIVGLVRRVLPVTSHFHRSQLFVRIADQVFATPLFLVLAVVASADLLFALDAVPAIFAVTDDPFLVLTSNAFSVLGLRSLYFAVAPLVRRFRYLKMSLGLILLFLALKMFLSRHYDIGNPALLGVISGSLGIGILASILRGKNDPMPLESPLPEHLDPMMSASLRMVRTLLVTLVGSSVLLIGIAMVILPGPALLVIPAGLAILATEYAWARRLIRRLRSVADSKRNQPE